MPGPTRNLSGCLSGLFIVALACGAAFILLRPAPPLPDGPLKPSTAPPIVDQKSPPVSSSEVRPPTPRDDSADKVEAPSPPHRRHRDAADSPPVEAPPEPRSPAHSESNVVENVTVLDRDERVVYRGSVDVGPTLERIAAGNRLDFPDDGIVFQNRERRLPAKPRGYYHEYVLPTPRLGGPGPQRVVIGENSEVYYTPDHYRTFRRVR
jgi:guanyl-specific ribonuclease Sa